jgi:hypothetical protein
MGLLEKLGLTAPRPRVAQADVTPAADVERLRGEVAALLQGLKAHAQATRASAQIATAEAALRDADRLTKANDPVHALQRLAQGRQACVQGVALADAHAAYLRRKAQVQALVDVMKNAGIAAPQLESDRQRVFVAADALAAANPADHVNANRQLDQFEQAAAAAVGRWGYDQVAGTLEALRRGPVGTFMAEDLRQLDALRGQAQTAAQAHDWTRLIFVNRTLRRLAEAADDVAQRRHAYENVRTRVQAKLAGLRQQKSPPPQLPALDAQLAQADALAAREARHYEQGTALLQALNQRCDRLVRFVVAANGLATDRTVVTTELAALRKQPNATALADTLAAADAALRRADEDAQAAAALDDPLPGTEAARADVKRVREDLAAAKAAAAQLGPAVALQAAAPQAATVPAIRAEVAKLRRAFAAAANGPGAELAKLPLEAGGAALALAESELAAKKTPAAAQALQGAAQQLLRVKLLQADAQRQHQARKALRARLAALHARPEAKAIETRLAAVVAALAQSESPKDQAEAAAALHVAEAALQQADRDATARSAFDMRVAGLEREARQLTDGLGVDFEKAIVAARRHADALRFDAATKSLDKAEMLWERVRIGLLAQLQPADPQVLAGVKRLVQLGDAESVDAVVKHLPDNTPDAVIAQIAQARFGVLFELHGPQATAGAKHVYAMLAKAPQDVKGNPSLAKVTYSTTPTLANVSARGGQYDSEHEDAQTWGRPDVEQQAFGKAQKAPGSKKPQLPDNVEERCRPLDEKPVEVLDWAALHELGHSLDDATGFMKRRGKDDDCGGWIEYGADVQPIANAVARWAGVGNEPAFVQHLVAWLEGGTPPPPPRPARVDADTWKGALVKVEGWLKRSTTGQIWYDNAASMAHRIGDRIYQRPYPDEWVSYKAEARQRGLTGFQFKAPGEWFAELYAGYRSGKLKPNHPAMDWLKDLRI